MSMISEESQNRIYQQVQSEFNCDHPSRSLTRFVSSSGAESYRIQCMRCGETTANPKKSSLSRTQISSVIPYNDELKRQWSKSRSERYQQVRAAEEEKASRKWFESCNAYLDSPQWKARRRMVLTRAKGVCEGCLERPASQVHHLTYERVGSEMLFDLVAVCDACHASIHAKSPE